MDFVSHVIEEEQQSAHPDNGIPIERHLDEIR